MKVCLLLAAVLLLAGCGSKKADPYATANRALLARVPVYPGAASPKTTVSGDSNTQFGARDWTLPAKADADAVIAWYEQKLQAGGWKIVGKSFETIRATRGHATLSVGVRGRTLEAVANSRGA
jgi:predicted component of type VI protein secretion system